MSAFRRPQGQANANPFAVRSRRILRTPMRVRTLLLLLALGVALPVLGFAILVSTILLREERDAIQQGAVERARAMMSAVDAKLRGDIEAVRILSASQALQSDDVERFRQEAELALDVQRNWNDVLVAAPDGKLQMAARSPLANAAAVEEKAGVETVARTLRPVIGNVLQPGGTGIPMHVPVFRNGNLIYVITVLVVPASFDVLIQAQGLPTGWTSGIVDGRGNFVARIPYQPAGQPASRAFREATANSSEGWYRGRTVENRDTYTAYRRSELTGWTIGLAVPADLVLAATWKTAWLIGFAALIALAIAFALAILVGRRIVAPVVALAKVARKVGDDAEVGNLPSSRIAEIDGVASALKDANDAVRHSRQRIADELDAMRRLHEFATRLNSCHDLDTALQEILRGTIAIGDAQMGNVQLFQPLRNGLEIVAHQNFDAQFLEHFRLVSADDVSACGRAMKRGATVVVDDVDTDASYAPHRAIAAHAGYRAVQSTPMLSSSGDVLGVISTHFREPTTFSERELRILDLYARHAADVIERLRNEQAVRDGTLQRQLALDAARLGWWHLDPLQKRASWDERYKEILGITDDSGDVDSNLRHLHPDDVAPVLTAVGRALDPVDPEPYSVQYRVRRSDGALRWIQAHGVAAFEGAGEARRARSLVGTVEDITEAKRAAELARQATLDAFSAAEANAKFRAFFEQGSHFAGVMTLDGTVVEANRLSLDACGFSRDQVIGRKFWDGGWWSPSPELRQMIQGGVKEAAAGHIFRRETPYFMADGSHRMVDFILAPVTDESGQVLFIAPTGTDITDRKRAEDALRASEQRFRSLVSIIADVLWVTDAAGAFASPQSSWEAYTGQTPEEYEGFGWVTALHPDDRVEALRLWKLACESRALFSSRGRLWHAASRRYRHFVARAIPLLDASNEVREWVGSCTDTDDAVMSTEALKEADRRKDEFLATLAHELRNPLAPIRNSIEILRKGNGNGASAAVDMMQRQVTQMVRLIDDLFDASRISRGKVALRKSRVELTDLVQNAVEAARPLYAGLGQDLEAALSPRPIHVDADPARLLQVVGNLLNNASKFTPRGGKIDLRVERVAEAAGDVAIIRVRDNGIGIDPGQLPRIFDMFAQVDMSLERSQSGLGIGLTLVKDLVEMHGGSVDATSAGLGHGSEFAVRIPVAVDEQGTAAAPEPVQPTVVAAQRILVVDDNQDAATSLATLLQLSGHETHVAHDGAEAIDKATALRPHVILLDIGLPQINGYEAARIIRRLPWGGAVTLVALTGWGQADDREKSKAAGFDRHLVKPVDLEALLELLAELAANRSAKESEAALEQDE